MFVNNYSPVASGGDASSVSDMMTYIRQPTMRRPYFNKRGIPCVTVNRGRWTVEKGVRKPILEQTKIITLLNEGFVDPVFLTANATSLRKEQWIQLDSAVQRSYREPLQAWADLVGANPYGGFNAMGKMTLEYEAMSDPGEAIVDMDGMTEGRQDSPLFKLRSIPLPITHSDWWFSQRRIDISRGGDTPLDTVMGEAAGRRIAEKVEDTTIGIETGVSYGTQLTGNTAHDGTSTVYGYTNFPSRLLKVNFTAPSGGGWTPETLYNEVLAAIAQLMNQKSYGPFYLYFSNDWFVYMNRQFSVAGGNNAAETLLTMLQKIPQIDGVKQLFRLTSTFTLLLVEMKSTVAQGINGMDITTVQWPTMGGMRQNFKTMAIQLPRLFSDYSGRTGILHGTTT